MTTSQGFDVPSKGESRLPAIIRGSTAPAGSKRPNFTGQRQRKPNETSYGGFAEANAFKGGMTLQEYAGNGQWGVASAQTRASTRGGMVRTATAPCWRKSK